MSYARALLMDERKAPARVRLVAFAMAALLAIIAVRGGQVALRADADGTGAGRAFAAQPPRADILDRNGELLATSVTVYSLFADPRAIWDPREVAEGLATVFEDLDVTDLEARLSNRERAFVWVRRQITPRQRQAVFDLGLEGLGFREESRRAYPRGTMAGHVLGYTGIDGEGLSGVEFSQQDRLHDRTEPLRLTLDAGVQFALEAELSAAALRHQAIGAAGVLIETQTGDVLAMASWPPINPNRAAGLDGNDPARLDHAARSVFELGSVFKPLTVALALDAGVIRPADTFDVTTPLVIAGHQIRDDHPLPGLATPTEIVAHSSNIGTVRISMQAGARRQEAFFGSLGLLDRAPVQLPGSAAPLVPEAWSELSSATASFGHGIAVSPLAFTAAFNTIANDGEYVAPNLILEARNSRPPRRRVMAAPTARLVTAMLRESVVNGTGANGEVAGYGVAGKTGTAEKPIAGGYSEDENISSFAAIFPADRPQYALLIVLDTPRPDAENEANGVMSTTAAWNAAPTAGRVIQRVAPLLGLMPRFDQPSAVPATYRSVSETRSTL